MQYHLCYYIGPPPAPKVSFDQDGSINSTFLISWSQSNCAVQYVVTIINSSDDRVYPNITASNTNTTVTLPTGVEFCVTLVAVDSIGRRGLDSVPTCYRNSKCLTHACMHVDLSCEHLCSACNHIKICAVYISCCYDQH